MAKGGHSQKSNGSRFSKPYDVSNSFVTKVASRVSDYFGGWFGSSKKSSTLNTSSVGAQFDTSSRRPFEIYEVKRPSGLSQTFLHGDDAETTSSPAKRFKLLQPEKSDADFPISPIPSTSGLFTSAGVNHSTFELPRNNSEGFVTSDPGPSNLPGPRYSHSTSNAVPQASSTISDVKANGTTDNHSDSSETTSGCSSLVPQSDRLSQSAYACTSRKKNLEEKLKYARRLQQSRTNMFLNRSIPVREVSGVRNKPSFDVTAYNSTNLDKTLLREKLISSPFYAGQTSYGGASAYRISKNTFPQKSPVNCAEKREGVNVEVKSSHHGSTETLTNMSHTAKKILEALEQFSTPVNDAKRIPINRLTPLGAKRKRIEEWSKSRMRLATPISPLNPNPGPLITGLNVPTVPDLLKLKRLERIQNSTVDARQVAVEKSDYKLPVNAEQAKRTGKIVTKLRDKEKNVSLEKLEMVNLPKIPLPITNLPKFDFQLPIVSQMPPKKNEMDKTFKFSDPIFLSKNAGEDPIARKNNFTFSNPLDANDINNVMDKMDKKVPDTLINFISNDTVAKLKRKSINDSNVSGSTSAAAISVPAVPTELKTGSVVDFFKKSAAECKPASKVSSVTWECGSCLIRNLNESKICCGCKASKVIDGPDKTQQNPSKEKIQKAEDPKPVSTTGFGDKFKPPPGSWSCKECFVSNKESATKCIACEALKPSAAGPPKTISASEVPKPTEAASGFGDLFKKQANQWECSTCMIRNKDTDLKCIACETPKAGTKFESLQPKLGSGTIAPTSGFLFGIDKAGVKSAADSSTFKTQSSKPSTESTTTNSTNFSQFKPISTSVGVFTFGIPSATAPQENEEKPANDLKQTSDTSNNRFMVTSTSGSGARKDESTNESEKSLPESKSTESKSEKNEISVTDSSKGGNEAFKSFIFGATNKASTNSIFETPKEEIKSKVLETTKKPSTFFFGGNSNSLDTVSSSTTDFTFRPKKPTTSQSASQPSTSESIFSKPPSTFQFKAFGWADTQAQKSSSNPSMALDANEAEVKTPTASSIVSTSVSVTTSAPVVGSASLLNDSNPKTSFASTSTTCGLNFMSGSLNSSNPSPFSVSAQQQSFGSSVFGSQTLATSAASNSNQISVSSPASNPSLSTASVFGTMPSSSDKPTVQASSTFGNTTGAFGTVSNLFASNVPTASNPEPAKPFGGLGSSSTAMPDFGANPNSAFSNSFAQPEKKLTNQPFIFGSTQSSATSSTTATATPSVFSFGASKTPQFSFGQSTSSNFNFGSTASTTNVFGNFGQPKPNESLAAAAAAAGGGGGNTTSVFGNSTSIFGQSSAPAAFGSAAPTFEFGNSAAQQQQSTTPGVFQFGATSVQSQPASAPAAGPFSSSIPQIFDFTGGQTPEFNATPESNSVRKVIKAVRRTKPKRT